MGSLLVNEDDGSFSGCLVVDITSQLNPLDKKKTKRTNVKALVNSMKRYRVD
jgi:hypothetical protein